MWNRFMKVIGGSPGKEALLISLKSGHVYEIFVESSQTPSAMDISMHRQKIAVIDDNSTLFVYNLKTNDLTFQEPNAKSVA